MTESSASNMFGWLVNVVVQCISNHCTYTSKLEKTIKLTLSWMPKTEQCSNYDIGSVPKRTDFCLKSNLLTNWWFSDQTISSCSPRRANNEWIRIFGTHAKSIYFLFKMWIKLGKWFHATLNRRTSTELKEWNQTAKNKKYAKCVHVEQQRSHNNKMSTQNEKHL